MNTKEIVINDKTYEVKFDIKTDRILAKMWKVTKFSELGKKLAKIQFKEGEEPDIEQIEIIAELILAGIKRTVPNTKLEVQDTYAFLINNPTEMVELIVLYTESQPLPKDAVIPKNVKPDQKK